MKHPLEYDQVKSDIIKASGDVFTKYGFAKVSMQDISKASGKGRTTLYYYFKNKGEVLEAFAGKEFIEMLNKSQIELNDKEEFAQNIQHYYQTKLQVYKKLLHQYSKVIEDIKAEPSFFIQKNKLFFKEEVAVISKIIEWAVNNAEIALIPTANIKFLAETLVTAFRSFEQEMILFGGLENFESKLNWLTEILYKGLK
ncbi:MAG: TetR/AcrR family transcriptional regulator [Janthinobacterium lividum]